MELEVSVPLPQRQQKVAALISNRRRKLFLVTQLGTLAENIDPELSPPQLTEAKGLEIGGTGYQSTPCPVSPLFWLGGFPY